MMVSIIIPTYNRPALLQRAVGSALAACPGDGEVIVVDDRSDTAVKALRDVLDHPRLRILTNTGDKGAAGARNHGVAHALGEIVMFLDDDDTMVADYPARVLLAADQGADWGFSARHFVDGDEAADLEPSQAVGQFMPRNAPLQKQIAAFSAGFWVRRAVFCKLGGIAPEQVNDEDTDMCCRLVAGRYRTWFEPDAGCVVYRGYETGADVAPQLTRVYDRTVASQCYARTFTRNEAAFRKDPAARWFLMFRALRACARNQTDDVARGLLATLPFGGFKGRGYIYWQTKRLGKRLGFR